MTILKSGRFILMLTFIVFCISGCGGGGNDLAGDWTTVSAMPTTRAELGVAAVNGKIYAIGGISGSSLPFVEEYDPATDTWIRKTDMPTARQLLVVAAVNGKIYAIGGMSGSNFSNITYTNVTEEYDPLTDSWTEKSPFPIGTAVNYVLGNQYIGGAAANGKIYIVAFNAVSSPAEVTHIYDPLSDTWDIGAPVPFKYTRYSVTTLNDTIYVLANDYLSNTLRLAKYDADSNVWLIMSSPAVERLDAQLVAANGKLYAIGGHTLDYSAVVAAVEEYDPTTDKWMKVPTMPTARQSAGLVALDGNIYVIGGSGSAKIGSILPLSTVEVFSAF